MFLKIQQSELKYYLLNEHDFNYHINTLIINAIQFFFTLPLNYNSQIVKKLPAYNLQEMLIVLAIIGILLLIAMPSFMPLITKAKSIEAQVHLKAIFNSQKSHHFIHSVYSASLNELDYQAPLTVIEDGTAKGTVYTAAPVADASKEPAIRAGQPLVVRKATP